MRIVVDHVAGSRRGQRQEFPPDRRVRFGRHPDNEVSFDAHRDLDASSRHAELRREAGSFVLRDIGSSNGVWVRGERLTEIEVPSDEPLEVEFGSGGPRVRLYIGDPAQAPEQPVATGALVARGSRSRRALLAAAIVVGLAAAGAAFGLDQCVASATASPPSAGASRADLSDNAAVCAALNGSRDGRHAHAMPGL